MDKAQLSQALSEAVNTGDRSAEEKIFLRLLKQVWEIDWTIAPYDVWTHMIEWDIPYFRRFMVLDDGDEREEEQLIRDWTEARLSLGGKSKADARETKKRIVDLIQEVNVLRSSIRQAAK